MKNSKMPPKAESVVKNKEKNKNKKPLPKRRCSAYVFLVNFFVLNNINVIKK